MIRRAIKWNGAQPVPRSPAKTQGPRLRFLIILAGALAVIGGATGLLKYGSGQLLVLLTFVVVVTLAMHRADGRLVRAALEYAAVGTVAVLLTLALTGRAPAAKPRPRGHSQTAQVAGIACAQLERVHLAGVCEQLAQLQKRASTEAGRRLSPPPTTVKPHHR